MLPVERRRKTLLLEKKNLCFRVFREMCARWSLSSWWRPGAREWPAFTCWSSDFTTRVKGEEFASVYTTLKDLLTIMPASLVSVTYPYDYPNTEWLKNNSNHLFCLQLCNLIRGQWRRLIAAVYGVSWQGSAWGWRICFQDCLFIQMLAVTWKLSLNPLPVGLCVAWPFSQRGIWVPKVSIPRKRAEQVLSRWPSLQVT